MADKTITMTRNEFRKYEVVKKLIGGEINGTEAAKQLRRTVRWVKKLKARVLKEGVAGVIHRLRGKNGNRTFPDKKIKKIETIMMKSYSDFGPTFAAEKLEENHQITINKESLRQYMTMWEMWKPKPRKQNKQYRAWRPRKEQYGELQQFDGSYHLWFEDRWPECCLLASIDDATGKLTKLWFDDDEGVFAVFGFWKSYIERHGAPASIYLDKFSTYKINHKSALDNQELITQFQRAAQSIGIRLVTAHSPEAKGRVERLFRTLQDRLIKELRLKGISSIGEANKFLAETFVPEFDKKFGVAAAKHGDLHRELSAEEYKKLPAIFSRHSRRTVMNDFTVRFKNQWLQLAPEQPVLVRKQEVVLIEERLDQSLQIRLRDRYLDFTILPQRPVRANIERLPALPARKKYDSKPAPDHPWRRYVQRNSKVESTEQTLVI